MMVNNSKKINIGLSNLLFYISIAIYSSYFFVNNSYFRIFFNKTMMYRGVHLITALFLAGTIISNRRCSRRIILFYMAFFILCLLVGIKASSFVEVIMILLFMIAGNQKKDEEVLKFCFTVNVIWLITVVFAANIGIIENVSQNTVLHGVRTYLGFTAHIGQIILFFCTLMFMAYKKNGIKKWQLLILFLANYYLYSNSDVRASFYLINIIILLMLLFSVFDINTFFEKKFVYICIVLALPIAVGITIGLPILYSKGIGWVQTLDILLSGRIRLGAVAMKSYKIGIFGQLLNFTMSGSYETEYFYIDSSYIKYLYLYGAAFMGIILVFYQKMILFIYKKQNYYYLLALIIEIMYFITGTQMLNVVYNPFLILIFNYVLGKKRKYLTPNH